jgi:primosomal replication protein N
MLTYKLPLLYCPRCSTCAVPLVGPGAGQHAARALCSHCGHFLKWLQSARVDKEPPVGCINRVILCGTISKYGVTVKYATSGTPCASFALQLSETGQDGKHHSIYVDCEVWGRKAEAAGELEAGQLALFEGKLARRKKNDQWELVVSGFDVTPMLPSVASVTGSQN